MQVKKFTFCSSSTFNSSRSTHLSLHNSPFVITRIIFGLNSWTLVHAGNKSWTWYQPSGNALALCPQLAGDDRCSDPITSCTVSATRTGRTSAFRSSQSDRRCTTDQPPQSAGIEHPVISPFAHSSDAHAICIHVNPPARSTLPAILSTLWLSGIALCSSCSQILQSRALTTWWVFSFS